MKIDELIMTLLVAILVSFGMALTGCGDSAQDALDSYATGVSCGDACTKYMNCSKTAGPAWLIVMLEDAGIYQEAYEGCMEECVDPYPVDEPIRDCALSCDLAADCNAYYDCVCNCGVEVYEGQCELPAD